MRVAICEPCSHASINTAIEVCVFCLQVSVPESVGGRWCHSVCSVTLNTNTVWIVVTGGTKKDYSYIEAADEVAMVVELG